MFSELSAGWQFAKAGIIAPTYEIRLGSNGNRLRYGPFKFSLRADELDAGDVKALGAAIGLNHLF